MFFTNIFKLCCSYTSKKMGISLHRLWNSPQYYYRICLLVTSTDCWYILREPPYACLPRPEGDSSWAWERNGTDGGINFGGGWFTSITCDELDIFLCYVQLPLVGVVVSPAGIRLSALQRRGRRKRKKFQYSRVFKDFH